MSTSDDTSKRIKVTDRRMFTADGELRKAEGSKSEVESKDPSPGPTVDDPARNAGADQVESETRSDSARQPEFVDLVSVLAEPIAIFLGDVPLPDGKSAENLDLARFHIDLLDLLKERTDSSLSSSERAMLDDLLYRLRMRYVQKSG